jgi:hypothetical protein
MAEARREVMSDTMPWQDYAASPAPQPGMPWMDFQQPQQPTLTGTLADILKSGGAQAAKDIAQVPMWLGDTANAATQGVTRLAGEAKEGLANLGIGNHLTMEQAQKLTNPTLPFYDSQQVIDAAAPTIKEATGADINYQPQTKEGEYTSSIIGAAPYAINPEMGLARAIGMGIGQQAGKDIASQFTNDPRYQQVARIAGGAGGMMAAKPTIAAAKYIADNDIGTKLPGILGDNRSGNINPQKPPNTGFTSNQAFDVASRAYQAADATGGSIQPADVNKWLDNSAKVIPQTEEGKLATGESPATNFLSRIETLRDKPMTFQGASEIDKALGQEIGKAVRTGDNTEVSRFYGIKNNLQDAINMLPDTSANVTEAKQAFSATSKMRDVENIMANAEGAEVPATAIKNGFRGLAKQLRNNPRGYTPEEIADINNAAKTGLVTGALKILGSKLLSGGVGAASGMAGGGAPGAVAGFATGEAIGYPLRQAAAALQRSKGQAVLNRIGNRPVFNQGAGNPELPQPESAPQTLLALPSPVPKEAAWVNENGTLRPQTPQEYWNGVLAKRQAKVNGLTPDVAKVQAQNALTEALSRLQKQPPVMPVRDSTLSEQVLDKIAQERVNAGTPMPGSSAWYSGMTVRNALDQAEKEAAVAKQIQMENMFESNETSPKELIENAAQKLQDSGISPGDIGEALLRLLKKQEGSVPIPRLSELIDAANKWTPPLAATAILANPSAKIEEKKPSTQFTIKTEPLNYSYQEKVPNTVMADALKQAGVLDVTSFAKAESGNNPNAKNPNSSASGLMQFTDGTWKQMVKRYGTETGIGMADKGDPKAQQVMAQLYAKDNINRMQPFLQRMPTKGELYAAHVLGGDGALRLIKAANETPNKQAIMLFPKAVTNGNRQIFFNGDKPRTVLDVYQQLSKKVS